MAIELKFDRVNGCSATAVHYEKDAKPGMDLDPKFNGEFTLSPTMQLSVKFSDVGVGYFGFNVGFVAIGANNITIEDDKLFKFGRNDGYGKSVSLSGDLSSLTFPITFYFTCAGCDYDNRKLSEAWLAVPVKWLSDYDDDPLATWLITDHTHIDKPEKPTISASTGKTITVKDGEDGEDGLYCTSNDDGWYDSPHKFTGLTQGRSYNFKCKKICPDCPDDKELESDIVTGRTWSISGSFLNSGAKSMTFKATHVAGTGGISASDRTITYKLYTSKSTSGTAVATKTGSNGIPVTFTGLQPGKTYYCYAYTTNLGDGDNDCWIGDETTSTKEQASVQSSSGDVSATTLRSSVSWSAGGAKSVECTMECNGQSRSISSSGSYVGFTGLSPGLTYTVSWRVISKYDYTYTYKVIEDGEEVEKTDTREETIETTGSSSYTTKKSQFGYPINVTSKIIQFKSTSNYSSDMMEQRISSNDDWDVVEQDTYFIYNNLTHNTSYTIYCRIAGCYAFDASGNQTNFNDSEISTSASTYLLSLSGSISEEHQHSIVTVWQSYVDGSVTNMDAIDGTSFTFSYMDTIARKNNPPYQSSEVIEGSNGNTTGDYQYDRKIYSNNLTWYYCEYIITASITDGYNVVASAVTAHTLFPATWLNINGQWRKCMPHIYTNGKWVPAPIFVYNNNKYTEPNGE